MKTSMSYARWLLLVPSGRRKNRSVRRAILIQTFVLLFCFGIGDSHATFLSETYQTAKSIFEDGRCNGVVTNLEVYLEDGAAFLSGNPEILAQIEDVMEYCRRRMDTRIIGYVEDVYIDNSRPSFGRRGAIGQTFDVSVHHHYFEVPLEGQSRAELDRLSIEQRVAALPPDTQGFRMTVPNVGTERHFELPAAAVDQFLALDPERAEAIFGPAPSLP